MTRRLFVRKRSRGWWTRRLFLVVVLGLGLWWGIGSHGSKPVQQKPPNSQTSPETPSPKEPSSAAPSSSAAAKTKSPAGSESLEKKVLVVLPLTGPFRHQGDMLRKGIELALAARTDGQNVRFIFEDGWKARQAMDAHFKRILEDPRLFAVLAHLDVDALGTLQRLAEKKEILVISLANAHEKLSVLNNVVSFLGSDGEEARSAARLIAARYGKGTVTVLEEKSPYGTFLARSFENQARFEGLSVTRRIQKAGDRIPKDVVSRSQKIFLAGSPVWAGTVVKALEASGYKGLYFVPHTYASDYAWELLSVCLDRVRFVLPLEVCDGSDPVKKRFQEAFRKKFWTEPDWLAAVGYDCACWVLERLNEPVSTPEAFARRILSGKGAGSRRTGVTGHYRLSKRGRILRSYCLAAYREGRLVAIEQ